MRRVLVTGATGFVGGHLVERLVARGIQVFALARQTSKTTTLERMGAKVRRGSFADPIDAVDAVVRIRTLSLPTPALVAAGYAVEGSMRLLGRSFALGRDKVSDLLQPHWVCSSAKLCATGYAPEISLVEGLAKTGRWYADSGWL